MGGTNFAVQKCVGTVMPGLSSISHLRVVAMRKYLCCCHEISRKVDQAVLSLVTDGVSKLVLLNGQVSMHFRVDVSRYARVGWSMMKETTMMR
jgi:hypothetical protein